MYIYGQDYFRCRLNNYSVNLTKNKCFVFSNFLDFPNLILVRKPKCLLNYITDNFLFSLKIFKCKFSKKCVFIIFPISRALWPTFVQLQNISIWWQMHASWLHYIYIGPRYCMSGTNTTGLSLCRFARIIWPLVIIILSAD